MQEISVPVVEVWDYFQDNKEELENNMESIAENTEFGIDIYIMSKNGNPCFVVTADDYQYAEQVASSREECEIVLRKLYDKYLTARFLEEDDEDDDVEFDDECINQEDLICEREFELDDAVSYLISVALDAEGSVVLGLEFDDICEDVKEHMLEYMARKHGLQIRRPMILEDADNSEEFFTEYPYEHMIFDDPDNPLYK